LHYAAEKGYFKTVRTLINLGCDVNIKDKNNLTPIYFAIKNNHIKVTKLLLLSGARWGATNPDSLPLFEAVKRGNFEILKFFVDSLNYDLGKKDKYNNTLLHIASMFGYLNIVEYLIDHNINIWALNSNGKSAYDLALAYDHNDIVKYLKPFFNKNSIIQKIF